MHSERQVLNIVECRYNAVWYHMILKTALQRLKQNINQSLPPHKTPHTSPLRASYGVSIVRIFEKNRPRYNDTAPFKEILLFGSHPIHWGNWQYTNMSDLLCGCSIN